MKIIFSPTLLMIALSLSLGLLKAEEFQLKYFKEIEVNFEEAESNNSNKLWRDREVNFGYRNVAVSEIVKKIMVISGKEVIGLEQLADSKPSMVFMTRVKAIKAVTILLKCEGFKMIETEKYFQVISDKFINSNSCLY